MRLIIIEDDLAQAKNLKRILEQKGYAVDWMDNPKKAKTRILLYRDEYDLVLLDLTLPGMSGMELTRSLRQEGLTTPIIIITGQSDTDTKIALLDSGADDYVVKPYSAGELIARINSVLRRPTTAQPRWKRN